MRISDFLAFYHLRAWEHKTGPRPLLYLPFAFAVAGRWVPAAMALATVSGVGVFMFAGAFDDYWDYHLYRARNVLGVQVDAERLSANQALVLTCLPLLLTVPLVALSVPLRLPSRVICLLLVVAVALLLGYSLPGVRLKERVPWGLCAGPLLAALLFTAAWVVLRPLTISALLMAVLLLLFQGYAEAMHVVDNAQQEQAVRAESLGMALWLAPWLPMISLTVSLGFAAVSPLFLITSGCSLIRWRAVRHRTAEQLREIRRNLWSPGWSLYEFAIYAGVGLLHGGIG